MRPVLAELVGTFILVWAGTGAIIINEASNGAITHLGIALVFGLVVLALIYTLGEVSGSHLNPAVTLSLAIFRLHPWPQVPNYVLAQVAGALLASTCWRLVFPEHPTLGATLPRLAPVPTTIIEGLLTAILLFAAVRISRGSAAIQPFLGVAIGAVIGLEALFAGPITGASMNPARSLGPALISGQLDGLWIYIIGPACGGVLGVGLALFLSPPTTPSEPS